MVSCQYELAQERGRTPPRPSREGEYSVAFDLWLQRQLNSTYGKADDAPLSPELERLLGQTDRR
mgnify:CR=1 FL=1